MGLFVILGLLFFCGWVCYSCLTRGFGFLLPSPIELLFLIYCVPSERCSCFVTADTFIFNLIIFLEYSRCFLHYIMSPKTITCMHLFVGLNSHNFQFWWIWDNFLPRAYKFYAGCPKELRKIDRFYSCSTFLEMHFSA